MIIIYCKHITHTHSLSCTHTHAHTHTLTPPSPFRFDASVALKRDLVDFTYSLMGRSSSPFVRPHLPMLYMNTGTTKDSYGRSRNGRLIRHRLNHTVDSLRKATFASCLRRATSSASRSSASVNMLAIGCASKSAEHLNSSAGMSSCPLARFFHRA